MISFRNLHRAIPLFPMAILACACSSSAPKKQETPALPVGFQFDQPKSKTDPDIVEETDAYYIRRYKKSEMFRKGNMVRPLILSSKVALPIYREDDTYYYIRTEKYTPEEIEAARKKIEEAKKEDEKKKAEQQKAQDKQDATSDDNAPELTPADFESIAPERTTKSVRLSRAGEGLPRSGQWRQNIALADVNGDGNLDIIASPARVTSGAVFWLLLGDGKGNFRRQPVTFVNESGQSVKPLSGYGGVAVADFDGDGKLDVALTSHGGGPHVFLQRDGFKFQVMDRGLPKKFSSQAIAAVDVDGDGKIDLVVSRDMPEDMEKAPSTIDMHQVRVYRNLGPANGWKYIENALVGGYDSNHVFPVLLDGDRLPSLVTGSNYLGATYLVWRNDGKGSFKGSSFDGVELSAYHFGIAPGRYLTEKLPAFADLFFRRQVGTDLVAAGVTVYADKRGNWTKVPVWRQKDYASSHLVSVAMGDLDGDGLDDVLLPDFVAKKLRIFFQTSDGKFVEAPESSEPALRSAACDIRLADLNGDGRLDVILAETTYTERPEDPGGFEVFLNEGR